MDKAAKRDSEFFNCNQKLEVAHVALEYVEPDKVAEFIKKQCTAGIIQYWTHEKLYAHLEKNGFAKKAH